MDLKSGGMAILFVLVGLFAACTAQADFDETLPQDIDEVEVYIAPDQDDPSQTSNTSQTQDVFVVSSDQTSEYVDFVNNAIDGLLNVNGEVTVNVPGGNLQQFKKQTGYDHKSVVTNSPNRPIIDEIVAVITRDNVRYNIFALTESDSSTSNTKRDMVISLIMEKQPQINILGLDKSGSRGKRAFAVSNIYQQLAAVSGGMVITATKNNIGQVANLIKQSIKPNVVDIMRFTFTKAPGQSFKIPVDETMSELTVQIQTASALPVSMVTSGGGLPVPPTNTAKPLGSKLMLYEFNITKPTDYGQWKFQKLAPGDWDVKVTGQSSVDFTYNFMEPGPGGLGSYPIKGRPIANKQYQIKVTVPQYDKLKTIAAVMLLDDKSMPIMPNGVISLKNVGGRRGKSIFTGNVTMPTVDFRVAIEAMDKKMRQARRLDPILVSPISIKLDVHAVSVTKLKVNETISLQFSVVNEASVKQNILVRIEDDHKFAQSPVNLFYSDLKANEMRNGTFRIQAGTTSGITDTVTITAKPYIKGQITQGQFEIRRFTVEDKNKKKNDTINPTCNVTVVHGKCNIGSDLCACVNHTWSMDVVVGDEGFGLQDIFPMGAGNNNSFTHDNFTVGHTIDKGKIKASLGGDCCHQLASIQVVDTVGNTAQCTPNITANFTAPDPKICNHTNVNLTVTCKSVTHKGQCNIGSDPCDCSTKSWQVTAEFDKTNNLALQTAHTIGAGNNATLTRKGQVVEINLDCCQQNITVVGEDIAGNIGECNISLANNFVPPKPSDCTTTTLTTVASTATSISAGSSKSSTSATNTPGGKSNSPGSKGSTGTSGNTNTNSPGGAHTNTQGSGTSTNTHHPGGQTSGQTNAPGTGQSTGGTGQTGTGQTQSKTAKSVASEESKSGVPESAVAAGMTIGTIGALSAVAVMAVLFRRAAGKAAKSVNPSGANRRTSFDRRDSAWS